MTAPTSRHAVTAALRSPVTLHYAAASGKLGTVLVARDPAASALAAILIADTLTTAQAQLRAVFPAAAPEAAPGDAFLTEALDVLVEGPTLGAEIARIPLALEGTEFQRKVWLALREIPAGETLTYAALASRLSLRAGARAVARACASNRHALAIPCHRIIRGDGSISGYRWGRERKEYLLSEERAIKKAREALSSRAA